MSVISIFHGISKSNWTWSLLFNLGLISQTPEDPSDGINKKLQYQAHEDGSTSDLLHHCGQLKDQSSKATIQKSKCDRFEPPSFTVFVTNSLTPQFSLKLLNITDTLIIAGQGLTHEMELQQSRPRLHPLVPLKRGKIHSLYRECAKWFMLAFFVRNPSQLLEGIINFNTHPSPIPHSFLSSPFLNSLFTMDLRHLNHRYFCWKCNAMCTIFS